MPVEKTHEDIAQWQDALIPHVVDRLAHERGSAKYGEWVTGSSVVSITYLQLANAINGLAWWLVGQLGPGYHEYPGVLTYVGPNDVRYSALVLAAIKAGYVIFVTSPRNSLAGHRALFAHLHIQHQIFITTNPVPAPAQTVIEAVKPVRHLTVPSVDELINTEYPPYVLNKTFEELKHAPFVVMHTSGSTGLPKPIIWTHETCARVLNSKSREAPGKVPTVEGTLVNGKRVIVTLPPFHGALLAQLVLGAIPFGNVVIAPVATAIPTAQGVVDALNQNPAQVAILVPSVVAEIARSPELLKFCAENLETILYIGGDLPQDLGDCVAAKMYLRCLWGATETGIVPQLLPEELLPSTASSRTLWRYVRFHPCIGPHFDEITDGNYELVIRREEALTNTQACFTVPGLNLENLDEEYRTKDLFEPHPAIPDLWRWRARADDIITFLNGEKTNPISMEQHIMASNPELSGALVVGAQRFQAALLLEPASDVPLSTSDQAALVDRVWPSVEEANRSAPAHARVEKSFIIIVPADRRLIRAGKGTFMRRPSISQYSGEIEKLYERADAIPQQCETLDTAIPLLGLDGVTRLIRQEVHNVMSRSDVDDAEGFFDRGMDSLQALQLTRALRRSLRRPDIALSTVYQNPTVSQLAAIVLGQTQEHQVKETMENLLATYKGRIQQISISKTASAVTKNAHKLINVMVTGTTGTVGTHLLRALMDDNSVEHIFCLNRREDGGLSGQLASFATAGFDMTRLGDNNHVTFLKADLQAPSFGLYGPVYDDLCSKVDLIIHAAWPVNFNLPLLAFRPHLAGLVNLLAFAAATVASQHGQPCRFFFVSSIAAVEEYHFGPIPEDVLTDLNMSAPLGYGQSKLLAELLLDAAAQKLGESVSTAIVRVGQVAGAVRTPGLWNIHEWFPSMVLSSLHFGQIPDSLGSYYDNVDFIPVDVLGSILTEIVTTTQTKEVGISRSGALVYNLRNPHPAPWRVLLAAVTLTPGERVKIVAPAVWLETLRASFQEFENDNYLTIKNPAVKLSDFFEKLWVADTGSSESAPQHSMKIERALEASISLRSLSPVRLEWMQKWVQEWRSLQKNKENPDV